MTMSEDCNGVTQDSMQLRHPEAGRNTTEVLLSVAGPWSDQE